MTYKFVIKNKKQQTSHHLSKEYIYIICPRQTKEVACVCCLFRPCKCSEYSNSVFSSSKIQSSINNYIETVSPMQYISFSDVRYSLVVVTTVWSHSSPYLENRAIIVTKTHAARNMAAAPTSWSLQRCTDIWERNRSM